MTHVHNRVSQTVLLLFFLLPVTSWSPIAASASELVPREDKHVKILGLRPGRGSLILGRLRVPIGQEVTIRGVKRRDGLATNAFEVSSMNGKPCSVMVYVDGIGDWPKATSATLRGYEHATVPVPCLNDYERDIAPGMTFSDLQTIYLTFKVLEVVEPKGLKVPPVR